MAQTKLGGSQAYTPIQKRYVQPTQTNTNTDLADAVKGVSNLLTNFAVGQKKEQITHTAEDKIRLVKQASIDSGDIDLAMEGGSKDATLNENVTKWRANGLSESQIRNKARNYKYDLASADWDLDNPEKGTDEAQDAYFNTLTQLEDKKLLPIVQADRKQVITDVKDEMNYYFMDSSDDYKTKLNTIYDATKQYRNDITEDEIEGRLIQIAVENGEEDALKDLKNNDGVPITQTVKGKEVLEKSLLKRDKKEFENNALDEQKEVQQQKDLAESYYAKMYDPNTNLIELGEEINDSVVSQKLSPQGHKTLMTAYNNLLPSNKESFAEESDPKTYSNSITSAKAGTMSLEQLNDIPPFMLSQDDYKEISRAIASHGLGGNPAHKKELQIIDNYIEERVVAETGANFEETLAQDFQGINIASKRKAELTRWIHNAKLSYIKENDGKLPSENEVDEMFTKGLQYVNNKVGDITSIEGGQAVIQAPTTNNIEDLRAYELTFKGDIAKMAQTLSTEQLRVLADDTNQQNYDVIIDEEINEYVESGADITSEPQVEEEVQPEPQVEEEGGLTGFINRAKEQAKKLFGFNTDEDMEQAVTQLADEVLNNQDSKLRNVRNNNLGNIKHNVNNAWNGATTDKQDKTFVSFDTPEHGVRALTKVVQANLKATDTIEEYVNRYASEPEEQEYYKENGELMPHLQNYAKLLANSQGIEDIKTKHNEDVDMLKWIKATAQAEGGTESLTYFTDDIILKGIDMASK